jgi:hypothetical protein
MFDNFTAICSNTKFGTIVSLYFKMPNWKTMVFTDGAPGRCGGERCLSWEATWQIVSTVNSAFGFGQNRRNITVYEGTVTG